MISGNPGLGLPAPAPLTQWNLGELSLSYGWQARAGAPARGSELLIPVSQPLHVRQGNLDHILRPPLDLLFLPEGADGVLVAPFHGWRLSMAQERLCQLAAELSGHRLSPGRCRRRLQTIRPLQPQQTSERELAAALRQLLRVCEATPAHGQRHLALVGQDRVIQRLLLLLLCGDLILKADHDAQAPLGSKARILEDLVAWIQAHLHRPIQLQDLVAQSGYSQRSLRNAFHERFGCGPVQWIRGQRLQAARARLLDPRPDDTVSQVAAGCGYQHLSQFSRDFQLAYGLRPSELLREGRRRTT